MPDLGAYAFEVSLAYLGGLGLLFAIVALSVFEARRAQRKLTEEEAGPRHRRNPQRRRRYRKR